MGKSTPMKNLKGQFSELNQYLSSHFEELVLQESSSKEIPYPFQRKDPKTGDYKYRTKGVKDEHLKIFKDFNSDVSLSFIFEFKNLEIDNWKIFASIKTTENNDSIIYSEPFSYKEFKEKLNELVSDFRGRSISKKKSEKLNSGVILNKFSELFLSKTFDLKSEIKKAENIVNQTLSNTTSKIESNNQYIEDTKNSINNVENIVIKSIKRTKEYKELEELNKRKLELEKELAIKTEKIENNHELKNKKTLLKKLQKNKLTLQVEAETKLEEVKKTFPKAVKRKLK